MAKIKTKYYATYNTMILCVGFPQRSIYICIQSEPTLMWNSRVRINGRIYELDFAIPSFDGIFIHPNYFFYFSAKCRNGKLWKAITISKYINMGFDWRYCSLLNVSMTFKNIAIEVGLFSAFELLIHWLERGLFEAPVSGKPEYAHA